MGRNFHPDEPNKILWLSLIRKDIPGIPKSMEERARRSKKAKLRLMDETHNMQDPDVVRRNLKQRPLDHNRRCRMCKGPLSATNTIGIGNKCLAQGLATGAIVLLPDGTYQIRKYPKRRKKS